MSDKGIGIKECPTHGEYHADAPDSPCPACEDVPSTPTKLECTQENAPLLAKWIRAGRGLARWCSVDLSNPGKTWTTPARTVDGKPQPKQNWQMANEPELIVESADDVTVLVDKEVKRFHVGVRRGDQGLSFKVTDGGSRRIRHEVAKAGDGAYHVFDYEFQDAVIMAPEPGKSITLTEWMKRNE
jgi:hypothetical protein